MRNFFPALFSTRSRDEVEDFADVKVDYAKF